MKLVAHTILHQMLWFDAVYRLPVSVTWARYQGRAAVHMKPLVTVSYTSETLSSLECAADALGANLGNELLHAASTYLVQW